MTQGSEPLPASISRSRLAAAAGSASQARPFAAMAESAAYREEERCFLDDMPGVVGQRAMTALTAIGETLGLDYAGIDFALTRDGAVIVFEANATMVINPPRLEPVWDYRRRASADVLAAAKSLLVRRVGGCGGRW